MLVQFIFAAHLIATVFMAGLIWFVQVVHYPLMASVGPSEFVAYERQHTRRTSIVVLPVMLVELLCALALTQVAESHIARQLAWLGLILLVLIWASTFALQVPLHRELSNRFDLARVRKLVATNWIRTAGWSVRAGIAWAVIHHEYP